MAEEKRSGRIEVTSDGPYLVRGVKDLKNSQGEIVSSEEEMCLCRCGRSGNKPFCDASHLAAGFSGRNECDLSKNKVRDYEGEQLTVHDNRWICAHVRYCTAGAPGAFEVGRRPWIDPDRDTPEVVKETIRRCPSGALSYSEKKGVKHEETGREAEIRIHKGPYEVVGGPELCGQVPVQPVCEEHYTLCRCGQSKNKPYCDGTHHEIGFEDEKN